MKIIGVDIEGLVDYHIEGVHSDYDTLCGIDANDPTVGHNGVIYNSDVGKITCQHCYNIWKRIKILNIKESSFSKIAKIDFIN